MSRRGSTKTAPSKARSLRLAAESALSHLAARPGPRDGTAGEASERHAALGRRVLTIAITRCAEAHHASGASAAEELRLARRTDGDPGVDAEAIGEVERSIGAIEAPDPFELGAVHEALLGTSLEEGGGAHVVAAGGARKSAGAHYTPRALAMEVARRAIAPMLPSIATPDDVLAIRVCDLSMGGGAFLLAACEVLAEALVKARAREAATEALAQARRDVARTCLFGVDKDPAAVEIARAALWIATSSGGSPASFLEAALRHGDALVGPPNASPPWPRGIAPFDWAAAFPGVMRRGGFDAIVGNPPWISYAGRAAHPLDEELHAFYLRTSPAFFGYRNLQALFVHRAATLLRAGGRLGLVIPTSMSDLGGYEPSRRAHDVLCEVDASLPDFGDRFDDVFQPCMGLFSTRRASDATDATGAPWPLERSDLDARAAALLSKLDALPKLPPATFGERGYQSNREDVAHLRRFDDAAREGDVELRIGSDVTPFRRLSPSFRCDPRALAGRFRREEEWRAVSVLIRQTARFPMACVSDGLAFRNSVLAAFATEELPAEMLAAYLNASPVRWFHYVRHRDARQGMPQLKIAHLRALPSPGDDRAKRGALLALGKALSDRNDGARPEEQRALDDLVSDLLGLDAEERAIVRAWIASTIAAAA